MLAGAFEMICPEWMTNPIRIRLIPQMRWSFVIKGLIFADFKDLILIFYIILIWGIIKPYSFNL